MASLFESGIPSTYSLSSSHRPLSSAGPSSMADTLPNINFGFDDLRERMARFTHRFDDFIAEGRKRVLEERNQFKMNVAELEETTRLKSHSLTILSSQRATHTSLLAREAVELTDSRSALASITSQRDANLAHRTRLLSSLTTTQSQIAARQTAQRQHAERLDAQSSLNAPELRFWEEYLCMQIEGAGMADRLKFVFTHVNKKDWEREAWFELCTEKRDYEVGVCRPKVEVEKVEACVERLNESRDLTAFLKGMRGLFVEAMG